jgi:hemerythrin-like domain-containing protein
VKITDALLGEHGALYAQFDRLEEELPHTTSAAEVREQAALLGAALVSHAKLEDELVFSRMLAAGGDAGLLSAMGEEHEQIADRLGRAQGTNDVELARTELLEAVSMARDHFAKEERLAFPLAESLLGDEALTALGASWAAHRAVFVETAQP